MSVLVTGAGLVASHVAQALQDHGIQVVLYDTAPSLPYLKTVLDTDKANIYTGDITNLPELTNIAQKHEVTCIVHTAAWIGAMVTRQPYRGVQVNVEGTVAVIEAARLAHVPRVVFCSSIAIYDLDRVPPSALITEEAPWGPKNLYGATKLAGEQILTQYGNIYDIQVVNLRLAVVFGRGQYLGGSWMGRVLNRVLESATEGKEAELYPEWLGTQEYVYSKDVAAIMASVCLSSAKMGGAYNIGTGTLHQTSDIVAEIRQIIPDARIRIVESQASTVSYLKRTQVMDISKAKNELGYSPRYSFHAGLREYVDELRVYGKTYEKLG